MQEIYIFHHDCIYELSRVVISDKILFSLSCSLKAVENCFFSRNHFAPNNKYTKDQILKYTHVKELNLWNLTRCVDLIPFKYLEKLTFRRSVNELNIYDYFKLTYFDSFRTKLYINLEKCVNLIYLRCHYVENIQNLINLQSLKCTIAIWRSTALDFRLLSHLTRFDLTNDSIQHQQIILSSDLKLIILSCLRIDFLNMIINGDKLIELDLYKNLNVSFSNLMRVQNIFIGYCVNVNIFNQEKSFQYLTQMNTDHDISDAFRYMTRLKTLRIEKSFVNIGLSFLTSLEFLLFKHTISNDMNISNLINLTILDFINSADIVPDVRLPRNIINLSFKQKKYANKIQTNNILKQTKYMSNLQILSLTNVSLLKSINQTSLTKLILIKSEYQSSNNFINLKHLVFHRVNMKKINMKYLSHLKKLILIESAEFNNDHLKELKSLEILKLRHSGNDIKFHYVSTLTYLILYLNSGNLEIKELKNLKSMKINNDNLFRKLCKDKLPDSLRDVYLKVNKKYCPDMTTMKNINLHFVK